MDVYMWGVPESTIGGGTFSRVHHWWWQPVHVTRVHHWWWLPFESPPLVVASFPESAIGGGSRAESRLFLHHRRLGCSASVGGKGGVCLCLCLCVCGFVGGRL